MKTSPLPLSLLMLLTACDTGDLSLGSGADDTGVDTHEQSGGQEGEDFADDTGDIQTETTSAGLHASSERLEFGPRYIGCDAESTIAVQNTSDTAVTIGSFDVQSGSGEFSLRAVDALPLTLAPGQETDLRLRYAPLIEGAASVAVDILVDQQDTPLRILGDGSGMLYGVRQEQHTSTGSTASIDLATEAVGGTLQIDLDGAPLATTDWSLSTDRRTVTLLVPPIAGARLDIRYAVPPPACD